MELYPENNQIYTYEDYQRILEETASYVKEYRDASIKSAKKASIWKGLVDFPVTIMLSVAIGGGFLDTLGNMIDSKWISYFRIVLDGLSLILLKTSAFWEFEKKKQKYSQAHALLSTFHNIIRQQIKIERGYEGNREDVIKEFTEAFENIKSSNIILQDFGIKESLSRGSSYKKDGESSDFGRRPTIYGYDDAASEESLEEVQLKDVPLKEISPQKMEEGPRETIRRGNCNTSLINDMLERL